jgi:hypothetical protein
MVRCQLLVAAARAAAARARKFVGLVRMTFDESPGRQAAYSCAGMKAGTVHDGVFYLTCACLHCLTA